MGIKVQLWLVLASGFFGISGVVLGAWLTSRRATQQAKLDLTFAFHREFFLGEMLNSRARAFKFLCKNQSVSIKIFQSIAPVEEMNHVWAVLEFYERLAVAIHYKRIDEDVTVDIFGEDFLYWQRQHFEAGLAGTYWEVSRRMVKMHEWLKTTAEKAQYDAWVKRIDQEYGPARTESAPAKIHDAGVVESA
jgi:hypothetical protein